MSMNTTSILNVGLNALLCTVLIALCKMSDLTMLKQFAVGVSSSKATIARSACKIFLMPCRESDLGCGEEPGGEGDLGCGEEPGGERDLGGEGDLGEGGDLGGGGDLGCGEEPGGERDAATLITAMGECYKHKIIVCGQQNQSHIFEQTNQTTDTRILTHAALYF